MPDPITPPAQPVAPVVPPVVLAAPVVTPPADPPAIQTHPWDDPKTAQAEIERLRKENGTARVNAKAQAAEDARNELAQSIGKTLGFVTDEPIDPAKLTQELTASQAETRQTNLKLAVFQTAAAANGDPAALLDSTSFLKSLDGIDHTDTAAVQAAIEAAVAANPRLGVATDPGPRIPAPNPAQGSSASGAATPGQLSEADVERLYADKNYAAIEKARQEGRLVKVLGG